VNGWDQGVDNNNSKTVVAKVGMNKVIDGVTAVLSGLYGPEYAGKHDGDNRSSVDLTVAIDGNSLAAPLKPLTLYLQVNWGKQQNSQVTGTDAKWLGFGVQPMWAINDDWFVGARIEYLDDKDGDRTGTKQKLWTLSVAPGVNLTKNIMARVEGRLDNSDKSVFTKDDAAGDKKTQPEVAAEVIAHF